MKKGGYKIIDFEGTVLSSTAVEILGIFNQIVDSYDKPILVSGVLLNDEVMNDAYAGVQLKIAVDTSKYVELTVYGGIITVTEDDEVTFTPSPIDDVVIREITGNESLTFSELLQNLFSGIDLAGSNASKYYVIWGSRIFHPYSTNGTYVCLDSESGSFANVIFRVVVASGAMYEGNGTFTLTDYSSSTTENATFQLIKRA